MVQVVSGRSKEAWRELGGSLAGAPEVLLFQWFWRALFSPLGPFWSLLAASLAFFVRLWLFWVQPLQFSVQVASFWHTLVPFWFALGQPDSRNMWFSFTKTQDSENLHFSHLSVQSPFEMVPNSVKKRPQSSPEAPKGGPKAPKACPKRHKGCPKVAQRCPQSPPKVTIESKNDAQGAQRRPKGPLSAPKRAK